jgi:Putative Tad-like Flp pilus-assembly
VALLPEPPVAAGLHLDPAAVAAASPCLGLAADPVVVAVEAVRVGVGDGVDDAEVAVGDVFAVQVGRRWRDAHVRVGGRQARSAALQTLAAEPELSGEASANAADVHVDVQQTVPTILLRLVGLPTLTVAAHATAAPREP